MKIEIEGELKEELSDSQKDIWTVCTRLGHFLSEKNKNYGNSALNPMRVFSDLNPEEQLRVRIDDKLSRIRNNPGEPRKNDIVDLMGYLVLFCVRRDWKDFKDLLD